MSDSPRWEAQIIPLDNGEVQFDLKVHAGDVRGLEVVERLAKLVSLVLQVANQRLPTVQEVEAARAERAVLREFPATRVFTRGEEQLWLAADTLPPEVKAKMLANGWRDQLPVPTGIQRPCDYARDPSTFDARAGMVEASAPSEPAAPPKPVRRKK